MVTVPTEVVPPATVEGSRVRFVITGALMVRDALLEDPSTVAVTVQLVLVETTGGKNVKLLVVAPPGTV